MSNNGYTNVQRKMLAILADGEPHQPKELHGCLSDELGPVSNVQQHISGIRKHLRKKSEDIICVHLGDVMHYRHVKIVHIKEPVSGISR